MPEALSFQQAEQPLEHAIPIAVWMKPAAETKARATENTFIIAVLQKFSSS